MPRSALTPLLCIMKLNSSLLILFFSLFHPALASVTILMHLGPVPSAPHAPESQATISQKCLALSPNHCCVPVDLSEESHTSPPQRYLPVGLDFQSVSPVFPEQNLFIWAGTNNYDCAGKPVTRLDFQSTTRWQKWAPKTGVIVTGFAIESGRGQQSIEEEKVVTYPKEISYKGGLYYEYLTGSLTYVKVSFPGDGPNIIYGLRQVQAGRSTVAGAASA
ncbi:MAG: hypothetical protein Q9194_005819 [Teloschistes cf. exilis]